MRSSMVRSYWISICDYTNTHGLGAMSRQRESFRSERGRIIQKFGGLANRLPPLALTKFAGGYPKGVIFGKAFGNGVAHRLFTRSA
jgi:hypothetical protein